MKFIKMNDFENIDNVFNESCVATDDKNKLSLHVTISESKVYGDIVYFKITEKKSFNKSSKCIRVCYKEAAWIDHQDNKQLYVLNSSLKKRLYTFLSSKGQMHETIWQDLISEHNRQVVREIDKIDMNTLIPDYTKPNWPCVSGKRKQIEMIDVINGKWDYDNDRGM